MIVKDESHVILRTLNNLTKYINFDYWVISDTGSSDNTKELIKGFFKDKNIPGELTEVPWQNFGINRSIVLQQAYNKSDYVFMFDADDQIMGNFILPKILNKDHYLFQYGSSVGIRLMRPQLFNNRKQWKYVGVLHEYIKPMEPVGKSELIKGDYYFTLGEEGNRSKEGGKYLKDANTLEKAFYETQNDKDTYLHSRYAYYCAQSYAGANNKEKSLEFYKKTLELEGWLEEKYVSCIRIYDMLENKDDGIEYLVRSSKYNSKRIECIFRLVRYYSLKNMPEKSFEYYKKIKDYYENDFYNNDITECILSVNISEYKFYLAYSMIIICDKVKDYNTGIKMYEMIFKYKYTNISQFYADNLISNLQFYYKHVTNQTFFIDMNSYIDLLRNKGLTINDNIVSTYKLKNSNSTNLNMNKIRLHIPAIPYTITRDEYSHDAFTGKVLRFSRMMRSRNFEVYHYGVETSESGATKQIDIMTKQEWTDLRIKSWQFIDKSLSLEDAIKKNNDPTQLVSQLSNWSSPLTKEFNVRFHKSLIENYRSNLTDIVCIPLEKTYHDAINKLNYIIVEIGIGYSGSSLNYRIFESYAWMTDALARENKQPNNYCYVIPHSFDTNEFQISMSPNPKRIGYLGRITDLKGCRIIMEIAKKFPTYEFVLCGQGDPTPYLSVPNIKYKGPIYGKERSEYLGSCIAFLHLAKYLEPFGCGPVEAQLCGTPVISTDWGGMVETVEQFKTGLRGHTLADFCYGVQMAIDGKFNRKYIRDRAVRLYDMYNVAHQYEYVLKSILDIHNYSGGWYSPFTHIEPLIENKVDDIDFKNGGKYYKHDIGTKSEGIPHIFFQTSAKDLPSYIYEMIQKNLSADWIYKHFTDNTILQYFNDNPLEEFPNIINIFKSFKKGCHRADIFRYYFLYINGGVFMDSDAMIYTDINLIINNNSFVSVISQNRVSLFNGIIAASPRNPIIKEALSVCYSTLPELIEKDYHYWTKALYSIVKENKYNFNYELYIENHPYNGITDTVDKDGNILFKHYWNRKSIPLLNSHIEPITLDKIYYINLNKRKDRNEHMIKEFNKARIENNIITRFEAVDGELYSFNDYELNLFKNADFVKMDKHKPYMKKIMGNQLSHFNIYKDMIRNNYDKILILQDDVIFCDEFNKHLNNICMSLPKDCDVLNIGLHEYANLSKFVKYNLNSDTEYMNIEKEKINEYVCKWKTNTQPCSLAYIITNKGAKNIISYFEENGFKYGTDISLNHYLINKDIFYGSRKILCTGEPSFGSDIFS